MKSTNATKTYARCANGHGAVTHDSGITGCVGRGLMPYDNYSLELLLPEIRDVARGRLGGFGGSEP